MRRQLVPVAYSDAWTLGGQSCRCSPILGGGARALRPDRLTPVPGYRVTVLTSTTQPMEAAMPSASIPVHHPAPAPDGPIACTLHPNEFAGRWDDFDRAVFAHLARMERPDPPRPRLGPTGDTTPGAPRELP